jgi:choline dehydrogenase-like flavoprotein
VPPSKTTIDSWEHLGNPGWNWNALRPYYAKAFSGPALQPELKRHIGIDWEVNKPTGPIQTSYASGIQDPISKAWVEAFSNIGLNMDRDPFDGSNTGAFAALASIDPATKERSYAATAYYSPVAHRQNLHVSLNSEVQRIILERTASGYCASGVEYKLDGQILTAAARCEIILAAGTIQSPKLLELSGIGNSTLLHSHGIDVKIHNKSVGENLQDHFFCAMGFEAQDLVPTLDSLVRQDPQAIKAAMGQYMATKDGPFASVGVDACAYLPLVDMNGNSKTNLEKLIDGNELTEDLSPLTKLYHDAMRQQLVSKYGPSGTYLTLAAQYMIPVDPSKILSLTPSPKFTKYLLKCLI